MLLKWLPYAVSPAKYIRPSGESMRKDPHSVLLVSQMPLREVWTASKKKIFVSFTVTESSQFSSEYDEIPSFFKSSPTPRPTKTVGGLPCWRSKSAWIDFRSK